MTSRIVVLTALSLLTAGCTLPVRPTRPAIDLSNPAVQIFPDPSPSKDPQGGQNWGADCPFLADRPPHATRSAGPALQRPPQPRGPAAEQRTWTVRRQDAAFPLRRGALGPVAKRRP